MLAISSLPISKASANDFISLDSSSTSADSISGTSHFSKSFFARSRCGFLIFVTSRTNRPASLKTFFDLAESPSFLTVWDNSYLATPSSRTTLSQSESRFSVRVSFSTTGSSCEITERVGYSLDSCQLSEAAANACFCSESIKLERGRNITRLKKSRASSCLPNCCEQSPARKLARTPGTVLDNLLSTTALYLPIADSNKLVRWVDLSGNVQAMRSALNGFCTAIML